MVANQFYLKFGASVAAVSYGLVPDALASESYQCKPLHPVFCENVHIGCAGRTSVPAVGFTVSLANRPALIEFADGRRSLANIKTEDGNHVLRLKGSRSWIRIENRGQFSQRLYRDDKALMAFGECTKRSVEKR